MSTLSVSYKSLDTARRKAKNVSRRYDNYADELERKVMRKLDAYDGNDSKRVRNAREAISNKMRDTRYRKDQYENYASSLDSLKSDCKSTDNEVKSRVSRLTSNFKRANGFSNNIIGDIASYILNRIKNKTNIGRYIDKILDFGRSVKDRLKSEIREWFTYKGGKDALKTLIRGTLDLAIATVGIILAVTFAANPVVLVAGIVLGILGVVDGLLQLQNAIKGSVIANNDPATAQRLEKIKTVEDYLTSSFLYGDDGEDYEYNKTNENIAKGIKGTKLVCKVIELTETLKNMSKIGFKWATDKTNPFIEISPKDLFSAEAFKGLKSKLGGLKKLKDKDFLMDFGKDIIKGTVRNIKNKYTNLEDSEHLFKDTKNILKLGKKILDDGWGNAFFEDILNNIPLLDIQSDTRIKNDDNGQLRMDFGEFHDNIKGSDAKSIFERINDTIDFYNYGKDDSKYNLGRDILRSKKDSLVSSL